MRSCPHEHRLLPIALGERAELPVREHVDTCPACRSKVDRLRAEVAAVRRCPAAPAALWNASANGAGAGHALLPSPPAPLPGGEGREHRPGGEGSESQAGGEGGDDTRGAGSSHDSRPAMIGRYRVLDVLGRGAFGTVYLAEDALLARTVAIKVPNRERVSRPEDIDAYIAEARVLAKLENVPIVPIYDAGQTEDGGCFVVSKYLSGGNLAERMKVKRPGFVESARIIAEVCRALHAVHALRIVHRDIKPENLLLDSEGKVYVSDFGLARRSGDAAPVLPSSPERGAAGEERGQATFPLTPDPSPRGRGGQGSRTAGPGHRAGTPAYMSPEQVRGDQADGRSDVFSVGVVFYELLTGILPFVGGDRALAEEIQFAEPPAPRDIDPTIPRALETICLTALAKGTDQRFAAAGEMAAALGQFLAQGKLTRLTTADSQPGTGLIPKGLRAFDDADADFFLELLPGPRDRNGLPESIRFWKTRIDEVDSERTFRVGLIYGPSGCGKSSLVRAGLIPRLDDHVVAIYLEATATDTEQRLLALLRKVCPEIDRGVSQRAPSFPLYPGERPVARGGTRRHSPHPQPLSRRERGDLGLSLPSRSPHYAGPRRQRRRTKS